MVLGQNGGLFDSGSNFPKWFNGGCWIGAKDKPTGVTEAASAVMDGNIYCFGGDNGSPHYRTNICEGYSAKEGGNNWWRIADYPTLIEGATASSYNNVGYIFGGYNGTYTNYNYAFNIWTNSYTQMTNVPGPGRTNMSSCELNGQIYIFGGRSNTHYNICYSFNPTTNTWTERPSMPQHLWYTTSCSLNGVVYVIGGYNGSNCVQSTQCFDPNSGTWWYAANIPTALKAGSCGVINGKIYLSGGSTYSSASGLYDPVSQTSVYDPSSGWTVLDTTVYPYGQPGACCGVVNDCLYVIGGGSSASVLNYCLISMRK